MRAPVLASVVVTLALGGCGSESPAPEPEPVVAAAAAPEGRPGERAIVERWTAAQADVTRIEGEQRAAEIPTPDEDRRVRLRRVVERDHALALATLVRDEAELDFYALACPDAARSIAESYRAAVEEERGIRARWLAARLEAVDADVALTDLVEDESAAEAAIDGATAQADAIHARESELEETVSESADRRFDLRLDARSACDERLPTDR